MMRGILWAAAGAFVALVAAFLAAFLVADPAAWPWLSAALPLTVTAVGLTVLFTPATWQPTDERTRS